MSGEATRHRQNPAVCAWRDCLNAIHPTTGRAKLCSIQRWRASEAASRMEINVSDFAFYPGNAFDSVYQADGINDQ